MEEVLLRFPHIGEGIFESLDEKSIETCRRLCRTWKNFIEDPNHKLLWIQIIKDHEKNTKVKEYVSCPQKWGKLKIQDLREFARLVSSQESKTIKEEMFLIKYAELNVKLDAKDKYGWKLFHRALNDRNFKLAELHVLNFDPNAKTMFGYTALHLACFRGDSKFIETILRQSTRHSIDVNAKTDDYPFDYGRTAFQFACLGNKSRCVEVLIKYGESFRLDFRAKDNNGETAFQLAENCGNTAIVNLIKRELPIGRY